MEEKFMNKRFDIYCAHDEANVFDGTDWDKYDVLLRFLEDVVKKENKKAEDFGGSSAFLMKIIRSRSGMSHYAQSRDCQIWEKCGKNLIDNRGKV